MWWFKPQRQPFHFGAVRPGTRDRYTIERLIPDANPATTTSVPDDIPRFPPPLTPTIEQWSTWSGPGSSLKRLFMQQTTPPDCIFWNWSYNGRKLPSHSYASRRRRLRLTSHRSAAETNRRSRQIAQTRRRDPLSLSYLVPTSPAGQVRGRSCATLPTEVRLPGGTHRLIVFRSPAFECLHARTCRGSR
jgi:hypothetical protein